MEYKIVQRQEADWKEHEGKQVMIKTKDGKIVTGRVRLKAVRCGKKGCTKCPHKIYAYAQYRIGKKVMEKYLGVAR